MFDYEEALKVVKVYMEEKMGVKYYTTFPGNNCVGVTYGRVTAYVTVRNGEVVEFMVD